MTDWKAIQARLNAAGFGPLTLDGLAGSLTIAAVKAFQTSKGLTPDGIVGPETLAALGLPQAVPTAPTGVRPAVLAALPSVFGRWEGAGLPYMYTDSKGLVTCGTGNLIDPIGSALRRPWRRPDGSLANPGEISEAWALVKRAWPGVQSTACQHLTTLRLDADGLADLLRDTVNAFYGYLRTRYPSFDEWPADAQLAVLSISWAWGAGFSRVWALGPAFDAAVNQSPPDFVKAAQVADQASINEEHRNPGIVPRDRGDDVMFANAAKVVALGLDPSVLHYPQAVIG